MNRVFLFLFALVFSAFSHAGTSGYDVVINQGEVLTSAKLSVEDGCHIGKLVARGEQADVYFMPFGEDVAGFIRTYDSVGKMTETEFYVTVPFGKAVDIASKDKMAQVTIKRTE